MIVGRYGIHIAPGNIPFLLQPDGAQNLISPELRFPFQPHIRPKTLRCPHGINLDAGVGVEIPAWTDEPFIRAFLPIPRQEADRALLVHDPEGGLTRAAETLTRLSSATGWIVKPAWMQRPDEMRHVYGVTNLSPMVFTSAEINHTKAIDWHVQIAAATQRQLVVLCKERVPIFGHAVEWIQAPTELPLDEPLEAIGAAALRRWMMNVQ
jgi:hypothetical protein